MADEDIAEYALALRELKMNSKPIITSLTMLADEICGNDFTAASVISGVIEKHIRSTRDPRAKLTGFYLLDSVVKNAKGHFVTCFARRLPDLFCSAFHETRDEPTRAAMARLLGTWGAVFPRSTLGMIAAGLPPGYAPAPRATSPGGSAFGGALPPPPGTAPRALGGISMNPVAAGSLLASMVQGGGDVSALLKSIAAAKAAQARGGSSGFPAGPAPLPPPPRAPSAAPPASTASTAAAAPRTPAIHEPSPLTARFDPSDEGELRKRRDSVVESFYGDLPHQCSVTGRRFGTRAALDAHLDLQHVRRRAKKESSSRGNARSRGWYVDADSWIAGALAEAGKARGAVFFERGALEKEALERFETSSVPVDETRNVCALSGEPFETFWNAEAEEWHYRGAVALDRDIGAVPAGSYVLVTAVPREGEEEEEEEEEEEKEEEKEEKETRRSRLEASSAAKRKRGPAPAVQAEPAAVQAEPAAVKAEPAAVKAEPAAVKAEPAAVKAEPADDDVAPAKRRSSRRA